MIKENTALKPNNLGSKDSNPLVIEDDDGIRPGGKPDECFYCHQQIGEPHNNDCVILQRKVKVRYSFDIEIEMPHSWDASAIESMLNESSLCASNFIDEIQEYLGEDCPCHCFEGKVIEIPDAFPYRKNKKEEIVD